MISLSSFLDELYETMSGFLDEFHNNFFSTDFGKLYDVLYTQLDAMSALINNLWEIESARDQKKWRAFDERWRRRVDEWRHLRAYSGEYNVKMTELQALADCVVAGYLNMLEGAI